MYLNNMKNLLKTSLGIRTAARCLGTETTTIENTFIASITELGLSKEESLKYLQTNNLRNVDEYQMKHMMQFLKKNYSDNILEVVKTPNLFQLCRNTTWEQKYLFLQECGMTDIPIAFLFSQRAYRSKSVRALKQMGLIPKDSNVVDNIAQHLEEEFSATTDLCDLKDDILPLGTLQTELLTKYFEYKLEASEAGLEKIRRLYPMVFTKSFRNVRQIIDTALKIGYSKQKIINNAYILQYLPENVKEVLEEFPKLLNVDIERTLRNLPRLMAYPMRHFREVHRILTEAGISESSMKSCLSIFTLNENTVKERIEDIQSDPQLKIILQLPTTLALIVHYQRAKTRQEFLEKLKLKCCNHGIIARRSRNSFDNYVKEGWDTNTFQETRKIFKTLLNCSDVDRKMHLQRHPFPYCVPFIQIEQSYNYLKDLGYKKEDLCKAMAVLLYPKENIERVLEELKNNNHLAGKLLSPVQMLNVVLYYLEKEHHFSGNGVWRTDDS